MKWQELLLKSMSYTKECLHFFSNAFFLLHYPSELPLFVLCHFLLLTMYCHFCASLFTYICLFFPSIFIVNCLHNPWAYINLSLNVFHFPFVSFNSIDLPYLIFLHYSKIHLAAVQHSYIFPFWSSLCPNYQPN